MAATRKLHSRNYTTTRIKQIMWQDCCCPLLFAAKSMPIACWSPNTRSEEESCKQILDPRFFFGLGIWIQDVGLCCVRLSLSSSFTKCQSTRKLLIGTKPFTDKMSGTQNCTPLSFLFHPSYPLSSFVLHPAAASQSWTEWLTMAGPYEIIFVLRVWHTMWPCCCSLIKQPWRRWKREGEENEKLQK